ncbi:Asp/Glu/hydantoin racemase [Xylophilus rhododendri]|uniref:Asp/Glu/hydantoin racemase n=1 Tax=Xylophilus rhododendri TaxID=2697032 RepID=A0A857J9V5_9BURK|nr:Asp/Glu/hydantoin racemase [Xylophilus rhododendri]QHJ00508.1 Asp/Glu/hydantoin racemase [Xylophilus rhododendri]
MNRHLLGMLTPSSNTVLEPVTSAMLAEVPGASAHFGRFRVTEIALSGSALAQFDPAGILTAAGLLADARCPVIGWSGTSSSWLGFDADERLCAQIQAHTGALACTSVLALNEVLKTTGVSRLGLVTPYRPDVQAAIVANYAGLGIACTERHLGLQDNFSFSEVDDDQIRRMVAEVMDQPEATRPQAITILCTNVRGAPLVPELEARHGVPVYDSIATVVWKALRLDGAPLAPLAGWGSIFSLPQ